MEPIPRRCPASVTTSPVGPRELTRRSRELRRRIGQQIVDLRTEANLTQAQLARCAGIDQAHLWRIEAGSINGSLEVLVAISACLGCDLSVRLYPGSGPRLHDRFQAPMIEGLLRMVGPGWLPRPECPVPGARGVIDLVLTRATDHLTIACECHSELRRLELVIRRAAEKTDALRAQLGAPGMVSSLLLLRSTVATRAIARTYQATLGAAFPGRCTDAMAALRGDGVWPGPAIVWASVEGGRAEIVDGPPRGVRLGR
jgi:transcriptional regulator with XRE-family HTH domain